MAAQILVGLAVRKLPKLIWLAVVLAVVFALFLTVLVVIVGGGGSTGIAIAQSLTACPVQQKVPPVEDLDQEQQENAYLIWAYTQQQGLSEYAAVIGIAVAYQEAKLHNLDYGDRDSLGLFQQRPSAGWGTPAQILNRANAIAAFYGRATHTHNTGLTDVKGWESMPLGKVAQTVQRSADPTGSWYAEHELFARRIVAQLSASGTAAAVSTATGGTSPGSGTEPLTAVGANIQSFPVMSRTQMRDDIREVAGQAGSNGIIGWQEIAPANYRREIRALAGWDTFMPAGHAGENPISWSRDRYDLVDSGVVKSSNGARGISGVKFISWVMLQDKSGTKFWVTNLHHTARAFFDKPYLRRDWNEQEQVYRDLVPKLLETSPVGLSFGDFNRDKWEDPQLRARGASWAWPPEPTHQYHGADRAEFHDYLIGFGGTLSSGSGIELNSDHDGVKASFTAGGPTSALPGPSSTTGYPEMDMVGAGMMCGTGTSLDCPPTPWPDVETGLTPDALRVLRCAHQQFPQIETFYGVGERESGKSDHPAGKAVDAMIDNYKSAGEATSSFRISSLNVLGHGHTAGKGRRKGFVGSGPRMVWTVQALNNAQIDVVGMQEFQPPQERKFLALTGGDWSVYPRSGGKFGSANVVAWRNDVWTPVQTHRIGIPYFGGSRVQMPYVQLRHRETGQLVWVASFHNPADAHGAAQRWRNKATMIEAGLARRLSSDGTPVFFTGDMNDREQYFCPTVKNAPLHSANGGSIGQLGAGARCVPPKNMGIDWVMGSSSVTFSNYHETGWPKARRATDHPFVWTDAGIGGTGKALGDQVAAWVQANAKALGVTYVIWNDQIWSVDRADEGWREYDEIAGCGDHSDNCRHLNHVHVSVQGNSAGTPNAPAGPWVLPVTSYVLTARFGECSAHWSKCHTGLDFAAATGTPIRAASAGVVSEVGWGGAYGNLTKITHADGVETWYAHQSEIDVAKGDRVWAGQPIGKIGTTGNTTGPHLHFEVRINDDPIDPERFLAENGVRP